MALLFLLSIGYALAAGAKLGAGGTRVPVGRWSFRSRWVAGVELGALATSAALAHRSLIAAFAFMSLFATVLTIFRHLTPVGRGCGCLGSLSPHLERRAGLLNLLVIGGGLAGVLYASRSYVGTSMVEVAMLAFGLGIAVLVGRAWSENSDRAVDRAPELRTSSPALPRRGALRVLAGSGLALVGLSLAGRPASAIQMSGMRRPHWSTDSGGDDQDFLERVRTAESFRHILSTGTVAWDWDRARVITRALDIGKARAAWIPSTTGDLAVLSDELPGVEGEPVALILLGSMGELHVLAGSLGHPEVLALPAETQDELLHLDVPLFVDLMSQLPPGQRLSTIECTNVHGGPPGLVDSVYCWLKKRCDLVCKIDCFLVGSTCRVICTRTDPTGGGARTCRTVCEAADELCMRICTSSCG